MQKNVVPDSDRKAFVLRKIIWLFFFCFDLTKNTKRGGFSFLLKSGVRLFLRTFLKILFPNRYEQYWECLVSSYHKITYSITSTSTLPDGNLLIYRPYSWDKNTIDEVYSSRVYDELFRPSKGSVVFDIGAHIGIYTLKASKIVGNKGLVISVEPEPQNFSFLLKNIKLNRLDNVNPINVALGSKKGHVCLYLCEDNTGGHSTVVKSGRWIQTRLTTLDELADQFNLTKDVFIKIDVEGAELEVLKGLEKLIKKHKIHIVSAAYHTPTQANELRSFLESKGFKVKLSERANQIFLDASN